MAIKPITDLEVMETTPTENDYIPITDSSDDNKVKKIPATAFGGGGGASAFVVNFSTLDGQTFTADKTMREIAQAIRSGAIVKGVMDLTALGDSSVYFFNVAGWQPLADEDWETANSGSCVVDFLYTKLESGDIFAIQLSGHYETGAGAHQFQDYWMMSTNQ